MNTPKYRNCTITFSHGKFHAFTKDNQRVPLKDNFTSLSQVTQAIDKFLTKESSHV